MTSPSSRLNSNSRLARLALAGAASALFLVAAGCSSSTTASTTTQQPASTEAQHISLVASTPATTTTTEVFSAKPGSVTVSFAVPSNVPHGLQVESPSGAVVGQIAAFENGTKSVTVSVTTGS